MAENISYLEEITSCLERIADEEKNVQWPSFVSDMKDFIITNYDGVPLATYKGDWKRRFKAVTKSKGYKVVRSVEDNWNLLECEFKKIRAESKRSTKRATTSGNPISVEEKAEIIQTLKRSKERSKWVLSTGKVVEDVFEKVIESSTYEHPAYSFLLDVDDPLWKNYFSEAELSELKSTNAKKLPAVPGDLQSYFNTYENLPTAEDIRKYAFTHYFNNDEFDKKWAQQSFISAIELFLDNNTLNLNSYSEADIFFQVWSFVYTLFKDNAITAKIGEKSSTAVSIAKNMDRSLELDEKRSRKATGAKVDILFKSAYDEVGSCEMGRDEVTEVDDKYFDDGLVKLPKTLRDMLSQLVKKNPTQINSMVTVGYLMMGIKMEIVLADVPVGNLICRIIRSEKYEFPQSVDTFAVDFIPLLELAWIGKKIMKQTVESLKQKKRKAIALSSTTSPTLPCSFYRRSSTSSSSGDNGSGNTSTSF